MRIPLGASIAWRYLRSKKSYSAVGTISAVSVCAMAIATAAIICVLSVFNGFRDLISSKLDTLTPDVMVTPAAGKAIANADSLARSLAALPEVEIATPTISDNALLICNSQEMPITLKGVMPEEYAKVTGVRSLIPEGFGEYLPADVKAEGREDSYQPIAALLAAGTAQRVMAYPDDGAIIFAPRREGRVNLANPAASFLSDSIKVAGVYRSEQNQFDIDGVIVPLETARRLFQYDTQATAVELKVKPGIDPEQAAAKIAKAAGPQFIAKDRMRQQEMNFRMVSIEKWVSFLLLAFILVIACFNIISALSMLVLEKEEAIGILSALGLPRNRIGSVFAWESIFVSAAGGIAGIIIGLILCALQMRFGLIKLAGDPSATIVPAYPVAVEGLDVLATFGIVALLGLVTAAVTAAFARSRANTPSIFLHT